MIVVIMALILRAALLPLLFIIMLVIVKLCFRQRRLLFALLRLCRHSRVHWLDSHGDGRARRWDVGCRCCRHNTGGTSSRSMRGG